MGVLALHPEDRIVTRSVSQYELWSKCPELYRLERVVGVPQKPAWYFEGGTAFHTVAEMFTEEAFYLGNDAAAVADVAAFRDWDWMFRSTFLRTVRKTRRETGVPLKDWEWAARSNPRQDGHWWMDVGQVMVQDYIKWRLANPHMVIAELPNGAPAIEAELNPVFGGVKLRAFPDAVYRDLNAGGQYLVVDYKTGATVPSANGIQLSTYAASLRQIFGWDVSYGAYYMARKGGLTPPVNLTLTASPDIMQMNLSAAYTQMDQAVELDIYPPNLGKECDRCRSKEWCVYTGGVRHPNDWGIEKWAKPRPVPFWVV